MRHLHSIGGLLISCLTVCAADQTHLKPDEKIVFYPTVAQQIPGDAAWQVEIRGRVFEPEKRSMLLAALRQALDLKDVEMSAAETRIFNARARLFLVDHERGKKIFVRHGDAVFSAGKSSADGSFHRKFILNDSPSERRAPSRLEPNVSFPAILSPDDKRSFSHEVFFLEATGVSVISDIDDTIKVTEVRDRNATLRNTFLREFTPVPGMPEFYQQLARSNHAVFHYISASPWQLYEPLAEFVTAHNFPRGTFELKTFRWKNHTFLNLFSDPEKYKPKVIEPLLKRFPRRHFILIGDSGERDPEIYAALARKYPQQIQRIYIRDVTGEPATAERYSKTFQGLRSELWQVFTTPTELPIFIDPKTLQP